MVVQTLRSAEQLIERYAEPERRAVVRSLSDQEAYAPLLTPERLWARVQRVSVTGIRLRLGTRIQPETDLVIELRAVDSGVSITLLARVEVATMQDEQSWILDCMLLTRPTEEQVRTLREHICWGC